MVTSDVCQEGSRVAGHFDAEMKFSDVIEAAKEKRNYQKIKETSNFWVFFFISRQKPTLRGRK